MVKNNKSWLIVTITVLVLILGTFIGFKIKTYEDQKNTYAKEAMEYGLETLHDECLKEGWGEPVCGNLRGSYIHAECLGQSCWIVNGKSPDEGKTFAADVSVIKTEKTYKIVKYTRNTGTPW